MTFVKLPGGLREDIAVTERKGRVTEVPPVLKKSKVSCVEYGDKEGNCSASDKTELKKIFANTYGRPNVRLVEGGEQPVRKSMKVGVVLSGGQAAGGHNVICGIYDYLRSMSGGDFKCYGFLNGPRGIYEHKYIQITDEIVKDHNNMGGFHMIKSGRDKIETEEQKKKCLEICTKLELNGLVVIGGDDSNTNACVLSEYYKQNNSSCCIIGAPKTIDGDLRNEDIATSFGFDTAVRTYCNIISQICQMSKVRKSGYHFIRVMGRSASNIAFECYMQTKANMILVGEEVQEKKTTLEKIVDEVYEMIKKRSEKNMYHGCVLIPEGLLEFIPEFSTLISELNKILAHDQSSTFQQKYEKCVKELSAPQKKLLESLPKTTCEQLLLDRDPHGNVQVALISTEKLLVDMVRAKIDADKSDEIKITDVEKSCAAQKVDTDKLSKITTLPKSSKMSFFTHYLGYEGRCAVPSNFDSQYCYIIGQTACCLINCDKTGYMACIDDTDHKDPREYKPKGCNLVKMMNIEMRKGAPKPVIKKYLVDMKSSTFKTYTECKESRKVSDDYAPHVPIQYDTKEKDQAHDLINIPNVTVHPKSKTCEEDVKKFLSSYHCNIADDTCEPVKLPISVPVRPPTAAQAPHDRPQLLCPVPPSKEKVFEDLDIQKKNGQTQKVFPKIEKKLDAQIREKIELHPTYGACITSDKSIVKPMTKVCIVCTGEIAPGINHAIKSFYKHMKKQQPKCEVHLAPGISKFVAKKGIVKCTDETIRQLDASPSMSVFDEPLSVPEFNKVFDLKNPCSEMFKNVSKCCTEQKYEHIVLVGGKTAIEATAPIAECMITDGEKCGISCIPCEGEGDLPVIGLGYTTVRREVAHLISNLCIDSLSASKYYYFVRVCGGDSDKLAYECGRATNSDMVVDDAVGTTVDKIAESLSEKICMKHDIGKNYGVCIIPDSTVLKCKDVPEMMADLKSVCDKLISEKKTPCVRPGESPVFKSLKPNTQAFLSCCSDLEIDKMVAGCVTAPTPAEVPVEDIPIELYIAKKTKEIVKNKKKNEKSAFSAICFSFGKTQLFSVPCPTDVCLAECMGKVAAACAATGPHYNGYITCPNKIDIDSYEVQTKPIYSKFNCAAVPCTSLVTVQPSVKAPTTVPNAPRTHFPHASGTVHHAPSDRTADFAYFQQNQKTLLIEDCYTYVASTQLCKPDVTTKTQ